MHEQGGAKKKQLDNPYSYPIVLRMKDHNINAQKLCVYYLIDELLNDNVEKIQKKLDKMDFDTRTMKKKLV